MSAWQRLLSFPARRPIVFGVGISALKTSAADTFVQLYIEEKKELDWRRSAVFFAWGAGYLGGVQYFIYVKLFARTLFPCAASFVAKPLRQRLADKAGQLVVLKQVGLDQFIHHPFFLFPCFYCVKEVIEGDGQFSPKVVSTALQKYYNNMTEDCLVCWKTWVPAFLFNFSVCPLWARIPFVSFISLGFTAYLSFLRGARQELPQRASLVEEEPIIEYAFALQEA
eukprot:TRINITY_DN4139_c0_g2_i1.p1 TRINITY_DN4139_c0_g2~~TRINITY_DN4139_c0_g2_i1.p1  ORF type:complete len:225 (+),score=37.01 TRINITY_DN4139_c0_g2_i1:173-847(+)